MIDFMGGNMEAGTIFEYEDNVNELKNIIRKCMNNVQFLEGFNCNNPQISIEYNNKTGNIRGYLIKDNVRKEIFSLRFERNEIKKFCIAYSLRRHGIGTAILKFVIEKYKNSGINEKLCVRPGGYECSHDDFKDCIVDNGKDKYIDQEYRIEFYKNFEQDLEVIIEN